MVRIKSRLKFRWILCFIIFSLVLLIYGNHLFKERAKKLEDMRKMESDMIVLGIKIEENTTITVVELLMTLYKFRIDRDKPYLVEIDRGDTKIAINEDNKVYFSQLFEEIV